MGAQHRLGRHLAQPQMAHVARVDHLLDRARHVFDRHVGIEPRRAIDVDMVRAEPFQRIGKEVTDRRRAQIDARPSAVRPAQGAELDAQDGALALAAFQRLAEQHLVMSHAIEVAGIEQRDARFQCRVDGGDALAFVRRTVEIRHAHATEPDGRYGGSAGAESARLHASHPVLALIHSPLNTAVAPVAHDPRN